MANISHISSQATDLPPPAGGMRSILGTRLPTAISKFVMNHIYGVEQASMTCLSLVNSEKGGIAVFASSIQMRSLKPFLVAHHGQEPSI